MNHKRVLADVLKGFSSSAGSNREVKNKRRGGFLFLCVSAAFLKQLGSPPAVLKIPQTEPHVESGGLESSRQKISGANNPKH